MKDVGIFASCKKLEEIRVKIRTLRRRVSKTVKIILMSFMDGPLTKTFLRGNLTSPKKTYNSTTRSATTLV